MVFVKTFKGYEDKISQIDAATNAWILANNVDVQDVKVVLSHEQDSRAGSGDLLFTVLYKADEPIT